MTKTQSLTVLFCAPLLLAAAHALSPTSETPAQSTSSTEQSSPAQPAFKPGQPLVVRAGDGSTTLTLTNPGTSVIPLSLLAAPITDAGSHSVVAKAKATLSVLATGTATGSNTALPPGTSVPAAINPGQTVTILASITSFTGASSAELPIYNGPILLGALPVIAIDAPLNITVEGEGSPNTPLAYTYAYPVTLTIKNGDPQSYTLNWTFQLDNQTQSSGTLQLPASGSARIPLKTACSSEAPPSTACSTYTFLDRVHPIDKQGTLLLSLPGPASIAGGLLPSRTMPINLEMRRVSTIASTSLSYIYAGILLFLGGLLSVIAGSVLPNMQAKAALRAQLKDLANRTTSISTHVDSYLRVLLRLERKRLEIAITDATVWLPAATEPLTPITDAMATLTKRVTAAERLDDLRRKHDITSDTAPPSVTDQIDTLLLAATDHLHSLALSDSELAAANAILDKAQTLLNVLDDPDTLAKLIASNLVALKTRLDRFPMDYAQDLKQALKGTWVVMDPERGYADPKNIARPMLFAIDHAVAVIQLALDYALVREAIPVAPTGQQGALPGQEAPFGLLAAAARARLQEREPRLLELLGTLSWRALREATNLVAQMREDVYEEDVLVEIARHGQAELTFDTQKPRPYLPVFFTITFKDNRYNGSAALQRMLCHWSFPEGLNEEGWKVCHYFSGDERAHTTHLGDMTQPTGPAPIPAPPKVPVPERPLHLHPVSPLAMLFLFPHKRVHRPMTTIDIYATVRGQRIDEAEEMPRPPLTTTIQIQRTAHRESSRYVPELLRFVIAFGVALAGLLSGALGQLEKLDFIPATIAILALGFGADSIKNLLTQPPKSS